MVAPDTMTSWHSAPRCSLVQQTKAAAHSKEGAMTALIYSLALDLLDGNVQILIQSPNIIVTLVTPSNAAYARRA